MESKDKIFAGLIAKALGIRVQQVENVIKLLNDGCTIPFISRYRKEVTGNLDEVQVAEISNGLDRLREMDKRKQTILTSIEEQGKLTGELRQRIEGCWDSTELEDIYLPYKPKRKTRAAMARERGLEPLADMLLQQQEQMNIELLARKFVDGGKGVSTVDDALQGARDIVAERVSEDEHSRLVVRANFRRNAVITSKVVKGKEEEGQKYLDYFDFSERLDRCPSHRLLAMRRGESEGILRISIDGEQDYCIDKLCRHVLKHRPSPAASHLRQAVEDGFKRLLRPSIETEFAAMSKQNADEEAIRIFARNLEQLLLAAPLGQKRVMGIDPGFRTGCKVVCLDAEGNLLHHEAIFPHPPKGDVTGAAQRVRHLARSYAVEAISIGNGTASRETEDFIRSLHLDGVDVFVVSEDGASIYSASKTAREEFPDEDVTVRGAVSIGRRLMDPLAELVKIDAKSIGVGQYQYDVNQTALKQSLDRTVEHCVNLVGVNVNTASKQLLSYVSGLGPQLAQNIVDYRAANGAFTTRRQLLKVPRMGAKAFEQSAGFLRVCGGSQPLDNSAVHPERYPIVERMAKDVGCTVAQLMGDAGKRRSIDISRYVSDEVGLPTLQDIMSELEKPGLDPRGVAEQFSFDSSVKELEDVHVGMVLPGIVTNITNFGCFVDVGVHTQGLVHVSQLADRFVKDPNEVVVLHQHVTVKVMEVDLRRRRMSLTMRV